MNVDGQNTIMGVVVSGVVAAGGWLVRRVLTNQQVIQRVEAAHLAHSTLVADAIRQMRETMAEQHSETRQDIRDVHKRVDQIIQRGN